MSLLLKASFRSFATKQAEATKRVFYEGKRLTGIKSLVGFNKDDSFVTLNNVDIVIKAGKIAQIGENLASDKLQTVDLGGALVTPGFVDPHTHAFPQKDRADEFAKRVNTSYEEIAKQGGGIKSSVRACRQGTYEEIFAVNERNVKRFI